MVAGFLLVGCGDTDGVGPPAGAPTLGSLVAVNTHQGAPRGVVNPEALARLRAAAVRTVRNDLDWASVETSRGRYDFAASGFDAFVAAAEHEHLRILFVLDYGNPLYGPPQAVLTEDGRAAYAAFAAAAATRYGGRGHLWEIWNEPNLRQFWNAPGVRPDPAQYARLVEAVVPALRRADPTGKILIGSAFMGLPDFVPTLGGVTGLAFLERLFATGVQARVDGITAHFYRGEAPETVAVEVAAIRERMAATGPVLPLWNGEWGYSTYDPDAPATGLNYLPAVTPSRQASYLVRTVLTAQGLGLAGSVWFKDRDAPHADPGDIEQNFGLMHDDLSAKPAYEALATLTRLLGAGLTVGELALRPGEHGPIFETPAGRIVPLWAEAAATWTLTADGAGARVLARDGRDITPAGLAQGAALSVDPDDGPTYLVGDIAVR